MASNFERMREGFDDVAARIGDGLALSRTIALVKKARRDYPLADIKVKGPGVVEVWNPDRYDDDFTC